MIIDGYWDIVILRLMGAAMVAAGAYAFGYRRGKRDGEGRFF